MAEKWYKTACGSVATKTGIMCNVEIRIRPSDLVRMLKSRELIKCPVGHSVGFADDGSAQGAAKWLAEHYPELLWPEKDSGPPPPPPPPSKPLESEDEKVKRLQAHIADIDDLLARRGKYK